MGAWPFSYWRVAVPVWAVASVGSFVYAAVDGDPVGYAVGFTVGWAFFIVALWYFIDFMRDYTRDRTSPEDILERRFARGEIDEDEYRRRRTALGQTRANHAGS